MRDFLPLRKMMARPAPAAIPTSASFASPGPFTSQPMTATLMGDLVFFRRSSTVFAKLTTSTSARPQDGHATRTAPSFRNSSALRISKPV